MRTKNARGQLIPLFTQNATVKGPLFSPFMVTQQVNHGRLARLAMAPSDTQCDSLMEFRVRTDALSFFALGKFHVGVHHDSNKLLERHTGFPTE